MINDLLRHLGEYISARVTTYNASEAIRTMATAPKWLDALESLPETPENIPAFFFAHGSPALVTVKPKTENPLLKSQGAGSPLYDFLAEFGPTLLKKYKPKGILVFSAHWETADQRLGEIVPF